MLGQRAMKMNQWQCKDRGENMLSLSGHRTMYCEVIIIIMGACGLKCNRIDYSHRICIWLSGKERKRNVSLWTPYMRVAVICIWGEEEAIKRPNWWSRGMLFWEWRADIELRGVGVSCRVVLFWELVRAA